MTKNENNSHAFMKKMTESIKLTRDAQSPDEPKTNEVRNVLEGKRFSNWLLDKIGRMFHKARRSHFSTWSFKRCVCAQVEKKMMNLGKFCSNH